MVCAKLRELRGGICDICQDQIRREAQGDQANIRTNAEKELKKHGVTPTHGKGEK